MRTVTSRATHFVGDLSSSFCHPWTIWRYASNSQHRYATFSVKISRYRISGSLACALLFSTNFWVSLRMLWQMRRKIQGNVTGDSLKLWGGGGRVKDFWKSCDIDKNWVLKPSLHRFSSVINPINLLFLTKHTVKNIQTNIQTNTNSICRKAHLFTWPPGEKFVNHEEMAPDSDYCFLPEWFCKPSGESQTSN